jgi:hypothetical protein
MERQCRLITAAGKAGEREKNQRDEDLFPSGLERWFGNAGRFSPFRGHWRASITKIALST